MAVGRKTGGRKPGTPNKRKLSPKAQRQVDAYLDRTAERPAVISVKATPTGLDIDHPNGCAGLALLEALKLEYGPQLAQFIGQIARGHRNEQGDIQARPINEMISTIVAIGPRDTVEAMLAAQMASVHDAVMTQAGAARTAQNIMQVDSATNALNKLSRTFAAQIEALNKHRSKGEQRVTVVHVHQGAQAVVGDVHHGVGGGVRRKPRNNPMCGVFPNARQCSARSKRSGRRCRGPAVTGWTVCRFHGARGGAPRGERNGNHQHGMQTEDAIRDRAATRELLRVARALLREI